MAAISGCEKGLRFPRIVLREHQSCFVIINPQRQKIRCITVDGCLNITGPKCDYLVIDPSSVEHFIELKGSDVRHAIQQLESSIRQLAGNLGQVRHSYIISTRSPLMSPRIQQIQLQFKKNLNSTLIIKSMCYELSI
jgi:hypothetical protein